MKIEQSAKVLESISDKLDCFTREVEVVKAIGISGSMARRSTDKLSDIDFCVYVAGEFPSSKIRKHAYSKLGFEETIYFGVDFETSYGDGFWKENVRCDFNWMDISTVQSFLQQLDTDFECAEFLPGGLMNVIGLYDPDNLIPALQAAIPSYTDQRAKHRILKAITEVHFSFYDLGWLEKAVYREDYFLFLKYTYNALEALFRALFALNKVWLSDEKGLNKKVSKFQYVPQHIDKRIEAIIMHKQENHELSRCFDSLKGLFADTVKIIYHKYPDLELPLEWQ